MSRSMFKKHFQCPQRKPFWRPGKRWWIFASFNFNCVESKSSINSIKFKICMSFWITFKTYAWRIWFFFEIFIF